MGKFDYKRILKSSCKKEKKMKKKIKEIIQREQKYLILLSILCLMSGYIGYQTDNLKLLTKQYSHDLSMYKKRESFCYKKQSNVHLCKKNGLFPNDWVDVVDDQLAVLPKHILNDFENTDWTITLTSNDIATTYSSDGDKKNSVKGITEYDFHKIYIQLDKESIYDTPLHEMGHWIDNYYGNLSKKDNFQEIYKKDGWHFKYDFYNISEFSQEEMFAEAIYIFYNEPNHLKEKCPNTYKYVKNFLN